MFRFVLVLLCAVLADALLVGTAPAGVRRAGSVEMYGRLPEKALVPRGKVSMNPLQNMKQMQDQRVAGASHILLAPGKCTLPLAEAKQLMESWKQEVGLDREKFAEIAKRESHCPTAEDGGDLGFMVRSACSQDFNDILFEKEAPGVYGPITTPAGLHLIYLNSCRDPTPNDNHFSGKSTLTENLPKMPWQK